MTPMNGKVYFSGYDATNGRELFETDGTLAGTTLVKDINPGGGSSYPTVGYGAGLDQFAVLGGKLYFGANDGTNGHQLWTTDGTSARTTIVDEINPGSVGTNGQGADRHRHRGRQREDILPGRTTGPTARSSGRAAARRRRPRSSRTST